jgi:hypothetical protein
VDKSTLQDTTLASDPTQFNQYNPPNQSSSAFFYTINRNHQYFWAFQLCGERGGVMEGRLDTRESKIKHLSEHPGRKLEKKNNYDSIGRFLFRVSDRKDNAEQNDI